MRRASPASGVCNSSCAAHPRRCAAITIIDACRTPIKVSLSRPHNRTILAFQIRTLVGSPHPISSRRAHKAPMIRSQNTRPTGQHGSRRRRFRRTDRRFLRRYNESQGCPKTARWDPPATKSLRNVWECVFVDRRSFRLWRLGTHSPRPRSANPQFGCAMSIPRPVRKFLRGFRTENLVRKYQIIRVLIEVCRLQSDAAGQGGERDAHIESTTFFRQEIPVRRQSAKGLRELENGRRLKPFAPACL